jgi:MFS family permease
MTIVFGFLTWLTGDWKQWGAVGLGTYAAFSWSQSIRRRDPPLHRLTWRTPAFMLVIGCFSAVGMLNAAVLFWVTPFAIRVHGMAPSHAGLKLGTTIAVCSTIGAIGGGMLADRWRRVDPRSPVWMGIIALVAPMPLAFVMFLTTNTELFLGMTALFALMCSVALGAAGALVQELVLPRMRGAASAIYGLCVTLLSSALGPYVAGKVSAVTGSLATGVLSLYAVVPIALIGYLALGRTVVRAEVTRLERARSAGEVAC